MDTYSLNGYQMVLLLLYFINIVIHEGFNMNKMWKPLKNTNLLFFENIIIKIGDYHMKAAMFKSLSWLT